MATKNTPDDRALDLAAFRYRVIADAIEAQHEAITEVVASAAARAHLNPRGELERVSERTLWRWLAAYREGGLSALMPVPPKSAGLCRAIAPEILEAAMALRRENHQRPTKTILDILVRTQRIRRGEVARSTLDRYLDRAGLSRRRLHRLGEKTFSRIETTAPFELVVGDFHHGPYVRATAEELRRAILCAFIDHYSRYVPEGRYYLHEDFAALRFGFRRLLVAYGLADKLYVDRGPSYQASRFHAACDALDIRLIHSKAYVSEGRGVVERFNRTVKEQFESEVRSREEPLTLEELNAYFEAWLAERYHRDPHSETGEPPGERFHRDARLRAAPDLAQVDELLRLRERRTVHRKWSTVEVGTIRYQVDPALRGRRVNVLYDPFAPEYVLIVFDGRVIERAFPQKPGQTPPLSSAPETQGPRTDYLQLLRADFEKRAQAELSALRLRPAAASLELPLADLIALLARCRAAPLSDAECSETAAFWRKMRPIDPDHARLALEATTRRQGTALHLRVYLDALQAHLRRARTKGKKKS